MMDCYENGRALNYFGLGCILCQTYTDHERTTRTYELVISFVLN